MKTITKIIVIVLCLIFTNSKGFTQVINPDTPRLVHYNNDTMNYLIKDFNDSTSLYKNKPLKLLLKKLEIKPFFYIQATDTRIDSVYSMFIYFISPISYKKRIAGKENGLCYRLVITFRDPIESSEFLQLEHLDNFNWNRNIATKLGQKIITDFEFYKR